MLKSALATLLLLALPFAGIAAKTQPTMDDKCVKGKTLFYGKMTGTGSEEKLCEIKEGEWYFWTRNGDSKDIIGTKVTNVKKIAGRGSMGHTTGYDFNLSKTDVIGLRAVYKNHDHVPAAGFIIINDDAVELDPSSVITE